MPPAGVVAASVAVAESSARTHESIRIFCFCVEKIAFMIGMYCEEDASEDSPPILSINTRERSFKPPGFEAAVEWRRFKSRQQKARTQSKQRRGNQLGCNTS